MRELLAKLPILRWLAIAAIRLTGFNTSIQNPWSGMRVYLNTYAHKSYWYYGKQRERATMEMMSALVSAGDCVVEVGGHIGWLTQFLSVRVGEGGNVDVFEPGENNLPYIRRNVGGLRNVRLLEKAVSDVSGTAQFFEDNVSGQNNSLLGDFAVAESTAKSHGVELKRRARTVELATLDDHVGADRVDFLKIDVEGAELQVLQGAKSVLARVKSLMVEVTGHHDEISRLLKGYGFHLYDESGTALATLPTSGNKNFFASREPLRKG